MKLVPLYFEVAQMLENNKDVRDFDTSGDDDILRDVLDFMWHAATEDERDAIKEKARMISTTSASDDN